MTERTSTTHVEATDHDDVDVQRTIFDFGDARIELSTKDELYLIKVIGQYTQQIGKELEKTAIRCGGNIGLAFEATGRDPRADTVTKFDSRAIHLLLSLRTRCESKGFHLFLCKPPQELTNALELFGAAEEFEIVESLESAPSTGVDHRKTNEAPHERRWISDGHETLRRQIYKLDVSLQRTDSLEKELDSAAECVRRFLPQGNPQEPGYDFASTYRSCEKVGGDFFDFVPLDDKTIGVVIGDVSGHGLDAALVMGISKKLINIRACDGFHGTPGEVLTKVNSDLISDLKRKTFVTALYGTLDLMSGMFRFARAGHEYPIAFRAGSAPTMLEPEGIALGMGGEKLFKSTIEDSSVHLAPGDCLLLVTDGLAECRNRENALYSRERLLFELSRFDSGRSAQENLDRLIGDILAFADGAPREDDMTALLIRRLEK